MELLNVDCMSGKFHMYFCLLTAYINEKFMDTEILNLKFVNIIEKHNSCIRRKFIFKDKTQNETSLKPNTYKTTTQI